MKTAAELRQLVTRIDHRSYPAYKDTKGMYQFPGYLPVSYTHLDVYKRQVYSVMIVRHEDALRVLQAAKLLEEHRGCLLYTSRCV